MLAAAAAGIRAFQSTPSSQRETKRLSILYTVKRISIHSLLAEGDEDHIDLYLYYRHFNPLPPRRGRRFWVRLLAKNINFNPLPPRRGRQIWLRPSSPLATFQSTPSSQRETLSGVAITVFSDFNPLPPRRGRPLEVEKLFYDLQFQSTPSSQRETTRRRTFTSSTGNFNPLPPRRGRP